MTTGFIPARRLARSTAAHVVVAAVAMGAWAAFANRDAPIGREAAAALTQGVLSGAITAGLKHTLERLSARMSGRAAMIVPPSLSCAATATLLVSAHILARTPDLWRTIALPWAVSSTYAWLYSVDLQHRRTVAGKASA